jgi:hypothetical protein
MKAAILVAMVPVLILAGIAFAYWTTAGSGSGTANTGTSATVTVNQTVAPTGLFPGGSVALSGDFDNPNSGSVFITAVTASVTPFSVQPNAAKPPCTQADFAITGTASVAAQIAAGNGVGAWTGLSLTMVNAATNQDNCKNLTVPIAYLTT